MEIKGHKVTLKELFTPDIDNHNTLLGGFMGFAHSLLSVLVMVGSWVLTVYQFDSVFVDKGIMIAAWVLSNLWWYRKETKLFTVSLFKKRSSPLVTLDTRLDFFNPLFWSSLILVAYF